MIATNLNESKAGLFQVYQLFSHCVLQFARKKRPIFADLIKIDGSMLHRLSVFKSFLFVFTILIDAYTFIAILDLMEDKHSFLNIAVIYFFLFGYYPVSGIDSQGTTV